MATRRGGGWNGKGLQRRGGSRSAVLAGAENQNRYFWLVQVAANEAEGRSSPNVKSILSPADNRDRTMTSDINISRPVL